jgi:predicted nuclease of predicted toxin-antitoxin system
MSISGILSNNLSQYQLGAASNLCQQGVQQLSKDLQSGNLSAAQSDFATLQAAFSQPAATTSATTASTSNSIAQAFNQLGTDLQSGNLSAAQKDLPTVQQDLQNNLSTNHFHHHHHLSSGSGSGSGDSTNQSSLLQDLNQVGQSLTSSNLAGAQQAYASLQQQLQQFALGGGAQSSTLLAQMPVSLEA